MKADSRLVGSGVVILGLVWLFLAFGEERTDPGAFPPDVSPGPRTACRVLTVYDGDTIGCDLNGNGRLERPREQIRLLGIDTPEMHYSRKRQREAGHSTEDDAPFARAASRWMETQVQGKTLYLEFDRERTDTYGRTLAHVFRQPRDTVSLNEELLRLGYASALFMGVNRRYQSRYLEVEHEARMQEQGMWGHWVMDVAD